MVDSVKCRREIKKNEGSNFRVVDGENIDIVDFQKGGFCGMEWVIGWMEGDEWSREMQNQTNTNYEKTNKRKFIQLTDNIPPTQIQII